MQGQNGKRTVEKAPNAPGNAPPTGDHDAPEQLPFKGGEGVVSQRQRQALARTVDGDVLRFLARLSVPRQQGLLALLRTITNNQEPPPTKPHHYERRKRT